MVTKFVLFHLIEPRVAYLISSMGLTFQANWGGLEAVFLFMLKVVIKFGQFGSSRSEEVILFSQLAQHVWN